MKKKELPPLPWDQSTWAKPKDASASGVQTFDASSDSGLGIQMGFYYVSVIRFPTNLTNDSILSGITNIVMRIDDDSRLNYVRLTANGQDIRGTTMLLPPFTNAFSTAFSFDTARLPNGTYSIQAKAGYANTPDALDAGKSPEGIEIQSVPITVTITNQIFYPDWDEDMGEDTNCFFTFSTVYPDANWQIDIYDVDSVFVRTLTGQATDGVAEANWDLRDTNGILRDDPDLDPAFYSLATVSPSGIPPISSPNPIKIRFPKDFPALGRWVVAYQDFFNEEFDNNSAYRNSILNWLNLAAMSGSSAYGRFPAAPGQPDLGQTLPLRFDHPASTNDNYPAATINLDKDLLVSLIARPDVRNFYIHAHGSSSTFSGGISSGRLGTNFTHRYRFVFIDGCSTFGGSLPGAFGINEAKTSDINFYKKRGIRPGAYLGFNRLVFYTIYDGTLHDGRVWTWKIPRHCSDYRNNFHFYWGPTLYGLLGRDLKVAIESAKTGTRNSGIRTDKGAVYDPGDGLDILGYDVLKFNNYNERSSWPSP